MFVKSSWSLFEALLQVRRWCGGSQDTKYNTGRRIDTDWWPGPAPASGPTYWSLFTITDNKLQITIITPWSKRLFLYISESDNYRGQLSQYRHPALASGSQPHQPWSLSLWWIVEASLSSSSGFITCEVYLIVWGCDVTWRRRCDTAHNCHVELSRVSRGPVQIGSSWRFVINIIIHWTELPVHVTLSLKRRSTWRFVITEKAPTRA